MRVYNGEIKRLIINVPPRYSKTEIAVINFMAWSLGKKPDCEFIHISYSAMLAANNAFQTRNLVQEEAYKKVFPDLKLRDDSKAKDNWRTYFDIVDEALTNQIYGESEIVIYGGLPGTLQAHSVVITSFQLALWMFAMI